MQGRCSVSRSVFRFTLPAIFTLGLGLPLHASAEEAGATPSHHHASAEAEGSASSHDHAGDLLLFPALTGTHLNVPVPGLKQNELMPEVNIFYSTDHGRLRFLAEFLLDREEHEMERLQLGWLVQPTATVWLGRFHTPVGFWNGEHHHGAFMQTTISRPGIVAFEDEGGVLPTHVAGLLAEGTLDRAHGAFNYAFGIGRGPELDAELNPVNVIEFRNGGDLALSARLSYRPFDERAGEFGGFAGYTRIPVVDGTIDEIDQAVAGVFYNLETGKLRLLAELFYVSNRLEGPATASDADFSAAYLQAEYQAHDNWTLFGRLEGTGNTGNNAYLDLNQAFLNTRTMAGARFEISRHQALKLEISRNERQDDARFNQVSLQWSMLYP
jgi:hypothetical protein